MPKTVNINGHKIEDVHMIRSVNFECVRCGLTSNYKETFRDEDCSPNSK